MKAIDAATPGVDPPFAALYLPHFRANADDLRRRAAGTPIRVASKSVRCRWVLDQLLVSRTVGGGFRGLMAYSLREALWLLDRGHSEIMLGYPTVDRGALAELGSTPGALEAVTLMVDDPRQLEIARDAGADGARVCIDVDSSLRLPGAHLGVRRSPLRDGRDVSRVAALAERMGFRPVGLMFYEAQVAGMQDNVRGISVVKKLSMRRMRRVRVECVRALEAVTGRPAEVVNSGGSGSVGDSAAAPGVTEVAAGSGFYVPGLFDNYKSFDPVPAMYFALSAVRRPAPGITTLLYGGYPASGVPGADRLPVLVRPAGPAGPDHPEGGGYLGTEGAGEVQTPVSADMEIGSRAWLRHAKAGELCERFDRIHLVDEIDGRPEVVDVVPTYRGEGKCFG